MSRSDFFANVKCEDNAVKNELDEVIDEIKRVTKKRAVRLVFTKCKNVSPIKSKLGGVPYLEEGADLPIDSKGKTMPLLIQINLSELEYKTALSKSGMLQFFISASGKSEGKVVYHKLVKEIPDMSVYEINVMPGGKFSPVLKECSVSFEEIDDYICVNDNSFNAVLKKAVKKVTGKELTGDMYDNFSDKECKKICKVFTGGGSKLFGNPCFTQTDVRKENNALELLLQIDSDSKFTLWGDCGAGNFFIEKEMLKKLDFSNIIYSWDCY